jgi:hypothetical protein
MHRTSRVAAAALTAAITLAACGGGAGSSPAQPAASATAAATMPPAAVNRTQVGTATLSLAYPNVLHANTAQTVRANGASSGRHAQFIDPSPSPLPSGGGYAYNVLDIYVDGTHEVNLDASGTTHSITVNQTGNGAQTVNIPLYSTDQNQIVAVEHDPSGNSVLAIGESDLGTFAAGQSQTLTLTMMMNATNIGVVDQALTTPQIMAGAPGTPYDIPGCSTPSIVGFYAADALGDFLPSAGAGTGTAPTVTGTSLASGTSTIGGSSVPGLSTLNFDGSFDGVAVTATLTNPAYAIYNSLQSQYSYYYYDHYYGYSYSVPYQGIWNLAYVYGGVSASAFSTQTVTRYNNILSGGCL